jgi:glycosyltransferase involved in cell wall biosynthesis
LKSRLWIVSELYYPELTSTGYFITRIAEGLASSMPVEVICGQPTYSEHGMRAAASEEHKGVSITRVRATHFSKDRLPLRVLNALTLTVSMTVFSLRNFRRGDQLLIVTNPPTLPPIIGRVARWKGMRAFLLVHDVYPEVLSATGHLKLQGLLYRMLKWVADGAYRQFDGLIVLGRDARDFFARKLGPGVRIDIIPNWGDVDEVVPVALSENVFAAAHNLTVPTIVQFSGNIGRTHDVETLLTVATRLKSREDILFLIAGFGGKAALVRQVADTTASANIVFLPRQPRDLLGPMLACSTATVIAFVDKMLGISVPSRMYNVLAAGTPIIALAHPQSELAQMVTEHRCGWVLSQGDPSALEELIVYLATPEGRADARTRGLAGRAAVESGYTLDRVVESFRALFDVNNNTLGADGGRC